MPSGCKAYRNISFATVDSFADLLANGTVLQIRGQEVRELRNRMTVLRRPWERCLLVPKRNPSIFAALAETMWVLGGRNEVAWLLPYLPRASQFSDDGVTWRAAYGPRLRRWHGVDQLAEVRRLLLGETLTRRAVMSLYDPAQDFAESKDIPCNNWLHWLIRDGQLHLNVAVRSNDAVWGFSGVNSFEWSVLHEMMAYWTKVAVGEATYLASSYHIYAYHNAVARDVVAAFRGISCYDFGLNPPAFAVPWENFSDALDWWFDKEAQVRAHPEKPLELSGSTDGFLAMALLLCRLHHGRKAGWPTAQLREALAELPPCDLAASAYEHLGRTQPELLVDIPQKPIAEFVDAYRADNPLMVRPVALAPLAAAIKALHERKNNIYGPAWKKRGEHTSILANLARKVDRIDYYRTTAGQAPDESIFDTAVDLFVYATKYRLFLFEHLGSSPTELPLGSPQPFSDHVANFNQLVDQAAAPTGPKRSPAGLAADIVGRFEALAAKSSAPVATRLAGATELADLALAYVIRLAELQPSFLDTLAG